MKNKILLTSLMLSSAFFIQCHAEEKEILFKDIPWGTSYKEAKNILSDNDWYVMHHDHMKTYSVDDILLGDYEGIDFDNAGFNMVAYPFSNNEIDVAGYTTSNLCLYLAFPVIDGKLIQDEENAMLYGARYEFEPEDFEKMYDDLTSKLSSLYGEPASLEEETDWLDIKTICTVWEGSNGTYVSLVGEDVDEEADLWDDSLCISYAWRGGDDLLTTASEALKNEALEKEASVYGNDDFSGL